MSIEAHDINMDLQLLNKEKELTGELRGCICILLIIIIYLLYYNC